MWNINLSRHVQFAVSLALPLGAVTVLACGPDFPMQLLDDRAATLRSTPANSFDYEIGQLLKPTDALKAREDGPDPYPDDDRVTAMRAQPDGDAAYAAGAGVAPALRLYAAGAVDYLAAQKNATTDAITNKLLARAAAHFQAVLDLPTEQGKPRAVAAAYMLGQLHGAAMTTVGHQPVEERIRAIAAYQNTRARALAGAPDPQGLAMASFGEQARLYLVAQGQQCNYLDFMQAKPCADAIAAADLQRAIHLYAEQAVRNSKNGFDSLRLIAEWALSDAKRAGQLIDDALTQRLLVSYALARVSDIVNGHVDTNDYYYAGHSAYPDAASGLADIKPNPVLQALSDALQARGIDHIADLDRVAALAYRTGNYVLAQHLAEHQHSALSSWVLAKLALRRGDTVAAAQAYAQAIRAFPQIDSHIEPVMQLQVQGEQGVLTLSRGQYVEAFAQLYAVTAASRVQHMTSPLYGNYVGDTVYLAERVLTTEELKRYIDAHLPATARPPAPPDLHDQKAWWRWRSEHPAQLSDSLRQILARRLIRDGHVAEALPYFPDDNDWRYRMFTYSQDGKIFIKPALRMQAKAYGVALYTAQHAWRANTRAQAWYEAAQLARNVGMEIMGAEQDPDFTELQGMFSFGGGRYIAQPVSINPTTPAPHQQPLTTPAQRADAALTGPFITTAEKQRYATSEVKPYLRFHYRAVAAEYAMRAADELPPRSQAFAAVLCQGVSYVFDDPEHAAPLYRHYLKQGAAVPFAADFGRDCPEPDFQAAANFPYRRLSHHRKPLGAGVLGLLLVGSAVLISRRHRKRTSENTQ